MVQTCCTVGCRKRATHENASGYYRIPKGEERRRLWLAAIASKDFKMTESTRSCDDHFITGRGFTVLVFGHCFCFFFISFILDHSFFFYKDLIDVFLKANPQLDRTRSIRIGFHQRSLTQLGTDRRKKGLWRETTGLNSCQ